MWFAHGNARPDGRAFLFTPATDRKARPIQPTPSGVDRLPWGDAMPERVISGGQTGVEQGGLPAASMRGITTGGWAPRGWLTEAGPAPWLADWGLAKCPEGETGAARYRARRRCVKDCDAALIFGDLASPG